MFKYFKKKSLKTYLHCMKLSSHHDLCTTQPLRQKAFSVLLFFLNVLATFLLDPFATKHAYKTLVMHVLPPIAYCPSI